MNLLKILSKTYKYFTIYYLTKLYHLLDHMWRQVDIYIRIGIDGQKIPMDKDIHSVCLCIPVDKNIHLQNNAQYYYAKV